MVGDFVNIVGRADVDDLREMWAEHSEALEEARGLFVVDDPAYECTLPGNRNFGETGFLRNLMASNRLILIQSESVGDDFSYSPVIFADTNFVSFCEAFQASRDLGLNDTAFRQCAAFLQPLRQSTTPYPYLLENADHPNKDKVRSTLLAFAAFKFAADPLSKQGIFRYECSGSDLEKFADDAMQMMESKDFKAVHSWAKHYFLWARIILLKATLIVFENTTNNAEEKFYTLLKFLHERLARILQLETNVAYRYFLLNSQEPFFNPLQQNSRRVDRSIRSMAWDLAHWRMLFDISTVISSRPEKNPFPLPHFVSFDRRFVRLIDGFHLDGVIFSKRMRRCEQFFTHSRLREMSDVLQGICGEFQKPESVRDRQARALRERPADQDLIEAEADLTNKLDDVVTRQCNRSA